MMDILKKTIFPADVYSMSRAIVSATSVSAESEMVVSGASESISASPRISLRSASEMAYLAEVGK